MRLRRTSTMSMAPGWRFLGEGATRRANVRFVGNLEAHRHAIVAVRLLIVFHAFLSMIHAPSSIVTGDGGKINSWTRCLRAARSKKAAGRQNARAALWSWNA